MKSKRIPIRKCIACNENRPKKELIRIVKDKENHIEVDLTGKANGRGAYICPSTKCLKTAMKKKQLSKALDIDIPNEIYEELAEKIYKIHLNSEK